MTASNPDRAQAIQTLVDWILQEGLDGTPFEPLIEHLCESLVAAGIPLLRGNFSMRAHHPEVGAFAYRWKRKTGIVHETYERSTTAGTGWEQSPLYKLVHGNDAELRHRLTQAEEPFPFPMFYELKDMGATDYFANQLTFADQSTRIPGDQISTTVGLLASWTSDGPDGFSDADLEDLRRILPPLGLALKSNANHKMASDLLSAYLGADAGGRVLSGDIGRGSLQTIEAVILYFDLQSFTKLSEALDGPEIIEMLNDYFGSVVPIIETRGGNVLKFMGDGLLAIFEKDKVPATELTAIKTIIDLQEAVKEINDRRAKEALTCTGFSIAVHAGEVLYGNIGSSARLDFTVIGPAVNTAARLMGMCSLVDQTVIVAANVARPVMSLRDDLVSLGQYRLRGVADRQELFTLD